jgi:4-amino-4-deoxy-L-arabinose transferase-like glycosyltransferase
VGDRRKRRKPRGVDRPALPLKVNQIAGVRQPAARAASALGVAHRLAAVDAAIAALIARVPSRYRDAAPVVLVLAAGAAFEYAVLTLLLHDPPVWPDEALFANPVLNLLRHGHLGTDLMGGYLPGIETRTYWMPPLYYLALAPVFGSFGVGVMPMRVFSALTAAVVLALTYVIGRRAGWGRTAACIAVAVLAVDAVFLRAARIGRMDMLAIALVLAALHQLLGRPAPARALIAAGVFAGLAVLTHPLAVIAPIAIVLSLLVFPVAPRRRTLLLFGAGVLTPLLVWGIYILADPAAFVAQFGAQLGRKGARDLFSLTFIKDSIWLIISQYNESGDLSLGDPRGAAATVWMLGTVGIFVMAIRHPAARPLAIAHLVAVLMVLYSHELWYPVYALPTLALGAGALVGPALEHLPGRRLAAAVVLAALGWFALRNLSYEAGMRATWSSRGAAANYAVFCDRVGALIPPGSRVFVSVFPDVYLCLAGRHDLTFRSFVPEHFPVSEETYERVIDESDIIVTGRWNPGGPADVIARRRGELVGEVGARRSYVYHALVYRMPRGTRPPAEEPS